jgi:hypothetical protein
MPRAPGAISTGGDRELAARLGDALTAAAHDDVVADSLTHPIHTYPARLHPATARALVELVVDNMPDRTVFLDPFCGSGTTLVEARAVNAPAIGVDLNPLAVRLAWVKTWTAPVSRRRAMRELGMRLAGDVLAMGRDARKSGHSAAPLRAPVGFDPNARQRRLARWFAPHVRRELEALAAAIEEVRVDDVELAEVLTVALSAILYKVSSRKSDTDPTWVERNVPRGAAARWFGERVAMIAAGLDDLAVGRVAPTVVHEADARALGRLELPPIGAVVTSPPYPGTYDYADQHRLRFDFLGLRHRAFTEKELGARRQFSANSVEAMRQWRADQVTWMGSLAEVLVPGRLGRLRGRRLAGRHPRDLRRRRAARRPRRSPGGGGVGRPGAADAGRGRAPGLRRAAQARARDPPRASARSGRLDRTARRLTAPGTPGARSRNRRRAGRRRPPQGSRRS